MPSARRYLHVASSMVRDLPGWHRGRPSSVETYLGLRAAHRATAGRSSQVARAVLKHVPRAVDRLPRHRAPGDPRTEQALQELRRDGLAVLDPVLGRDEVEAVVDFARRAPGRARRAGGVQVNSTWLDRPGDTAALVLDGAFSWARPELQRLMADARLHDLVARLTGFRPVVHPPQLYWTFPTEDTGTQDAALARRFHWDYDGIAGLRLHVYLTDVDGGRGPMEYLAGTHRPGTLRWSWPGSIDQGADLGHDRDTADRRTITGPAGTSFLTNPHGLHRATAPITGERLFLVMAMQGGGYAGYFRRVRALPVRDPELGRRLATGDPTLRLFEPAGPSATAAKLITR